MTLPSGSRHERDALHDDPHAVKGAATPPPACADQAIRLERRLPGGLDEVWCFLTRADQVDLLLTGRKGGKPTGTCRGEIRRAEPPRLLAFTWTDTIFDAEGPRRRDFLVTVELAAVGDAVRLALTLEPQRSGDIQG